MIGAAIVDPLVMRHRRRFAEERADPKANVFDVVARHIADERAKKRRVLVAGWTEGSLDRLGQILAPLREEGVLIVGSGSFTHDLASFRTSGGRIDAPEPDWVNAFAEWMAAALRDNRVDDLLNYRTLAPEAAHNHPTEEHLLPLYVALGVAPDKVNHLHQSTTYGILRMDAFAFG